MSRFDERRQDKAARTKAKVARPSQLATPTPNAQQKSLTIQQAINLGLEHHNAGRLPAAKRPCGRGGAPAYDALLPGDARDRHHPSEI